ERGGGVGGREACSEQELDRVRMAGSVRPRLLIEARAYDVRGAHVGGSGNERVGHASRKDGKTGKLRRMIANESGEARRRGRRAEASSFFRPPRSALRAPPAGKPRSRAARAKARPFPRPLRRGR